MPWGRHEKHRRLQRTQPTASSSLRAMHGLADPTCRHRFPFPRRAHGSPLPGPTAGAQDSLRAGMPSAWGLQTLACRTGCLGSDPGPCPNHSRLSTAEDAETTPGRGTRVFDGTAQGRCPPGGRTPHLTHQGWFPGCICALGGRSDGPRRPRSWWFLCVSTRASRNVPANLYFPPELPAPTLFSPDSWCHSPNQTHLWASRCASRSSSGMGGPGLRVSPQSHSPFSVL